MGARHGGVDPGGTPTPDLVEVDADELVGEATVDLGETRPG